MKLFHGTDHHFDEFSNDFLCGRDSIDQYGSGFYFYSEKSKTVLHGGLRIYADVEVKNPIAHDADFTLDLDQVETLLIKSPDLEGCLENYGDVGYEGFDKVLRRAVDSYNDMHFLDCLNALGNDFFPGSDCHILLSAFVEETGFDCITDVSRDIYVVLTKKQITIEKVIHEQDDE